MEQIWILQNVKIGSGKCLHPDTKINIQIKNKTTIQKFLNFFNIDELVLCVTIKNIVDFYKKYPEEKSNILVDTPYGYKEIEEAKKTDYSIPILIETNNNNTCISSLNHRYKIEENKFEYAKNLKIRRYYFK